MAKKKQWKPEPVVLTYEEQSILNWYLARKAFKENPWTATGEEAFRATEEMLAQIGMDVNVKNG